MKDFTFLVGDEGDGFKKYETNFFPKTIPQSGDEGDGF